MARCLRNRLVGAILFASLVGSSGRFGLAAPAAPTAPPSTPEPIPAPAAAPAGMETLPGPDAPATEAASSEPDPPPDTETPWPGGFPGVNSGVLLWRALTFNGNTAGRAALPFGPGGASSLEGPGGLSFGGLRLGAVNAGGFVDRDPDAALPDVYSLGYRWSDGSAAWGDGAAAIGASETAALVRSLRGLQVNFAAGPGRFSLAAGQARLQERHVVLSGRDSPGPYYLGNSGPILTSSAVVRIDGLAQGPDDYSIDPASGALRFDHDLIAALSVIDVRYEERREVGDAGAGLVGAQYALPVRGKSALNLTLLAARPGAAPAGGVQRITEGPYYATGAPMTITLGRGELINVESVRVDGAPLQAGHDYRVFPSARLLFLFRALPPESAVEVTYWYRPFNSAEGSNTILGLDSTHSFGAARLRWSLSGGGDGAAMDVGTSAPLLRHKLILGARFQHSTASFQSLQGLAVAPRQNGLDIGLTALPIEGLHFTGRAFDAAAPLLLPFLDVSGATSGPMVHVTGVVLEGGLSRAALPLINWTAGHYREAGSPFDREAISARYVHGNWGLTVRAIHSGATLALAPVAAASTLTPMAGFPSRRLDSRSVSISANLQPTGWITASAGAGWNRTASENWSGTSGLERASILLTPTPTISLSAGFTNDESEAPPWISLSGISNVVNSPAGAEAAGSAPFIASETESFDPAYALADPSGPTTPSPSDPGPLRDNPGRGGLPPGGIYPSMPLDFGSDASESLTRAEAPRVSQAADGWLPHNRVVNMSLLWHADPALSLQFSGADEVYDDNFNSAGNPLVNESAATMNLTARYVARAPGQRPGTLRLTASVGREAVDARQQIGTDAAGWIGEFALQAAPARRWQIGMDFSRAAGGSQGLTGSDSTLPGERITETATGVRLIATRAIEPGRLLFAEWNTRVAGGPGGFLTRSGAVGITFSLPAGFGLQLRAQHSLLISSTTPAPAYRANTISLSLVSTAR